VPDVHLGTVSGVQDMFSEGYRRYVLCTLTLVFTVNFLDRGLIGLLLQSIKGELHLSDTQLGFLTGIAFGLFYAILGLPIARWADRGNRVTIISLSIGLWGLTVMSCLLVSNFIQLVLARVAAGVGEAGCKPPTYSLVGDYFPQPAERSRAMAVYWLASPLSTLVSYVVGGWLNEIYGWRLTFLIIGIPGLALALLCKLTIVEPRSRERSPRETSPSMPPMTGVIRTLWLKPSSRHLGLALILLYTIGLGMGPWYAAFMMRSHGMGTAELGVWLGVIFGIAGTAGTLLGGFITARWFNGNERGQMRLSAMMIAMLVPCYVAFLLAPRAGQALAALVPLVIVNTFFFGPTFALLQRLVAANIRATVLAIIMLLANLIGMGIGPQAVGVLSDLLAPVAGSDSLRYAMLAMSFIALWSAAHFWRVGRTVQADLRDA
jgi:MFS family permease